MQINCTCAQNNPYIEAWRADLKNKQKAWKLMVYFFLCQEMTLLDPSRFCGYLISILDFKQNFLKIAKFIYFIIVKYALSF